MKSPLLVLLLFAVTFFFLFGTAFAAPTAPSDWSDTYDRADVAKAYAYVDQEYAKAKAYIEEQEELALKAIFGTASTKDFGNLTVTKDQVKNYYYSEVTSKALAQANKEYSDMYDTIRTALNLKDADYVGYITLITTAKADEGAWTSGDKAGYNVYIGFTKSTTASGSAVEKADYEAVFKDGTGSDTKKDDIAKDAFADAVAAKITEISAINPEAYIAKDQEAAKKLKEQALTLVNQIGEAVANPVTGADFDKIATNTCSDTITLGTTTASGITDGYADALNKIYKPAKNEQAATGVLATELAKLTLSADEPTQAAKLAWAKKQVLSYLEGKIQDRYDADVETPEKTLLNESLKGSKADQKKIDEANKDIEDAKELKEAALEIVNYLINDCDDLTQLITEDTNSFANSTLLTGASEGSWGYSSSEPTGKIYSPLIERSTYHNYIDLVKVVGYVQELKDEAAALKADIAIDGTTAVDIDELLKDAIDDTYKTGSKGTILARTSEQVLHARKHALIGDACALNGIGAKADKVKIGTKEYDRSANWDETAYEDARLDEVKAIKKETKKNIMAAATVADAEAAFLAGLDKYNAVLTKTDKTNNQATKAFRELKTKYEAQLKAEYDYAAAAIKAVKASEDVSTWATYDAALKADLAKAYTTDELTEIYNKLVAEVKALKTKTTLDAEKKALEERCAAYNSATITVADKAELVALRKDIAEFLKYAARIGATTYSSVNYYKVDAGITTVMNAEEKALDDQYAAINKDGKATLDEATAVADLRAALDAYNKEWKDFFEGLETPTTPTPKTLANLATFEEQIEKLQVEAVEKQIGALPATNAPTSAVKAAREAYNALTECQRVSVDQKYYDKLVDGEKLQTGNVETLKITASSTAKKGSITIKWTVKGDADAATAYEIWKSTKKNSGFKKTFTTKDGTKRSYKNTKGLKKGTRYYYKVRAIAYDANGKKVTSDWSNKAYRKAK